MKSDADWFKELVQQGPIVPGRSWIRAIQADALEAAANACWGPSEDHEHHWIPERRECWQAIQELKNTVGGEKESGR